MTGVSWLFKFVPLCVAGMNGMATSERNEALNRVLDDQPEASAPEADTGDAPTAQAYYGEVLCRALLLMVPVRALTLCQVLGRALTFWPDCGTVNACNQLVKSACKLFLQRNMWPAFVLKQKLRTGQTDSVWPRSSWPSTPVTSQMQH